MEYNKAIPKWFSVVMLAVCIALIAANIYVLCRNMDAAYIEKLRYVVSVLAFISAIVYCCTGYKKSSLKHFRAFGIAYLLYLAVNIYYISLGMELMAETTIYGFVSQFIAIFSAVFSFSIICIFLIAENLGRRKSCILVLVLFIANCLRMLSMIFTGGYAMPVFAISNIVYVIIFGMMVYAKYKDKETRGSN